MSTFTGTLNSNEIFAGLFNMLIGQTVFGTGLDIDSFVEQWRVDGTMFGDTKLYYSADVLKSVDWTQDSQDALNLLAVHRPPEPDVQAITINKFRQIALTLDSYMSKRAWGTEGAFAQFNSVMMAMVSETKNLYDYTNLATFFGTHKTTVGKQDQTVALSGNTDDAQKIAQKIADILIDVKRPSREYNDFGNMRAVAPSKLRIIWNSAWLNKIKKVDLPVIYHEAGLVDKLGEDVLPAEYFGTIATTAGTGNGTTIRSLVEKDYEKANADTVHCFAGDIIPSGYAYLANEAYTVDANVICKIVGVGAVPYMSAFSVSTSFFNARNLSTNQYLTFGHNTLESLKEKAFITLSKSV